jgi:WD40 repeat protein
MSSEMMSGELENGRHPERPDVFVSYSRKDDVFVRRLVASLAARGKDVWVDWEDIRKSVEWRTKIEAGIESANAVVPVLTPDFAASAVCAEEVEHAVAQNKRLVPILRRDLDGATLREELNARNWIFFRDGDDFETALGELVDALESDFDWLDRHARLLVRTLEWQRSGREKSFLLRGSDLRAAESWFAEQGAHREHATPLQGEYILASRQIEKRRQRITLGAVLVALVVASGLAVVAWLQRNDAVKQRHVAEQRAQIAISRELATRSTSKLAVDPALSVLLATDAVHAAATPEAVFALRQALGESRVRAVLRPGPATSAALSRDGKFVITAGGDDTVRVTRLVTKKTVTVMRWHIPSLESLSVISPDGRLIVTSGGDAVATLRNRLSRKTVAVLRSDACCTRGMAFTPDGKLVAVASGDVTVWNIATGRRVAVLTHPGYTDEGNEANGVAFTSDGGFVIAAGNDGKARVWNLSTRKLIATVRADRDYVWSVAFSPDGKRFATGGEDGMVRIWDLATRRQTALLRGHLAPIHDASFSPDGKLLLTASDDGTARLWEPATERTVAVLRGHVGRVLSATFSRDGMSVVTTGADATTRLWDVAPERMLATLGTSAVSAAVTPDGNHVLTGTVAGSVRTWDLSTMKSDVIVPPTTTEALDMVFSSDCRFVATTDGRGMIRIRDLATATTPVTHGSRGVFAAGAFSADDRLVAAVDPDTGTARVWERTSGRPVAVLKPASNYEPMLSVALSPDGSLALTASTFTMTLWEVKRAKKLAQLGMTGSTPALARFSPDGKLVVTTAADGRAEVWDVATRKRIAALDEPGHPYSGNAQANAAFSPDGTLVVVVREDDTAEVWDVATENVVAVLNEQGTNAEGLPAPAVAFSPNGRRIVVDGVDGVVRLYSCDICAPVKNLLMLARSRVTRELTSTERLRSPSAPPPPSSSTSRSPSSRPASASSATGRRTVSTPRSSWPTRSRTAPATARSSRSPQSSTISSTASSG